MFKNILISLLILNSTFSLFKSQQLTYSFPQIEIPQVKKPSPPVKQNFILKKYLGKWYQQAHTKNIFFQSKDADQTTAEYTMKKNGNVAVLNSTFKNGKRISGGKAEAREVVFREGILTVDFGKRNFGPLVEGNYRILDTDYVNYTIVYSTERGSLWCWVMTRKPVVSRKNMIMLLKKVKKNLGLVPNDFWFNKYL